MVLAVLLSLVFGLNKPRQKRFLEKRDKKKESTL